MRGRISHRAEHEVQPSLGRGWSRLWTFWECLLCSTRCEAGANAKAVRNLPMLKYDWSLNVEVLSRLQ